MIEARIMMISKVAGKRTEVIVSLYKDGEYLGDRVLVYEGVGYTKDEIKRLINEDLEAIFNTEVK